MDPLIYIGCALLGWVIFYYTIKGAIKNAIIETREKPPAIVQSVPEAVNWTVGQKALQHRYDRGEITLEQYHKEWDSV